MSWVADLAQGTSGVRHAKGLAAFERVGFPGPRLEGWKYTSTRSVAKVDWVRADVVAAAAIDGLRLPHAAVELVFVDGVYQADLSRGLDGAPVSLEPVAQAELQPQHVGSEDGFVAINDALATEGFVLTLGRDQVMTAPVHLLFLQQGGEQPVTGQVRLVVKAERHSRMQLIETHHGGEGQTFVNELITVQVADGAKVQHSVMGRLGSGQLVHTVRAEVGRDATYHSHMAWLSGSLVRSDILARLVGQGGHVELDGLYVLADTDHVDNHTVIRHEVPNCTSVETYKGVVGGKARGVFDGMVYIAKGADGTDSQQNNRNILLGDHADVKTKPTLEIYADDVKAAHGATVGQLDQNQLWYLRARGIPKAKAEKILTHAFVADRVLAHPDEAWREVLAEAVEARLAVLEG